MDGTRIMPGQVAELLKSKQAARMTQDGFRRISSVLESIRSSVEYRATLAPPSGHAEEAQSLIERLRSCGPKVVAELRELPQRTEAFRDHAAEFSSLASKLEQWLADAPDLYRRPEADTEWHDAAVVLWWIYKKEIDQKAGLSSSGPAVRFIRGALKFCGYPQIDCVGDAAIEKAVRRKTETNSFVPLCRDT